MISLCAFSRCPTTLLRVPLCHFRYVRIFIADVFGGGQSTGGCRGACCKLASLTEVNPVDVNSDWMSIVFGVTLACIQVLLLVFYFIYLIFCPLWVIMLFNVEDSWAPMVDLCDTMCIYIVPPFFIVVDLFWSCPLGLLVVTSWSALSHCLNLPGSSGLGWWLAASRCSVSYSSGIALPGIQGCFYLCLVLGRWYFFIMVNIFWCRCIICILSNMRIIILCFYSFLFLFLYARFTFVIDSWGSWLRQRNALSLLQSFDGGLDFQFIQAENPLKTVYWICIYELL